MRTVRVLNLLLAALVSAVIVAPGAAAEQPLRLAGPVTDAAGVLSVSARADVQDAVDTLYVNRRVRLWVIYVDSFSGQGADGWGRATARLSDLGDHDALLAVATADRSYAFLVSTGVADIGSRQVDGLRRDRIEPALHRGDWSGAAVAAADGLDRPATGGPSWISLLVVLGVIVAAGVILVVVMRVRRRRRRAAALEAARRVDATDRDALAGVPVYALDDLSRSMIVGVDNALRTSVNELTLAVDEFGEQRTEPFTAAVEAARTALAQAFTVRQQLDDAVAPTADRRDLLTGVIVAAAKADRELEAQREAFEQLRDLVLNAPDRLDALTRQLVELTARIPGAADHLTELHGEFSSAALASVTGNVKTTRDRVAFADRNIAIARQLATHPVTGGQSGLVDAVRAAESALGQARALLDSVDSAAGDIRHATATLPEAIAGIEAGIERANTQLAQGGGAHRGELTAARDTAVAAVATARGSADPLGAFTTLTGADADLDRLLDTLAEERASAERLTRALDQALFSAQARVRAVSDYIDTRRGSVGPEARTRLAEARRHLEAARAGRSTDEGPNMSEAIIHANSAADLAAEAQSLAKSDVQAAQQAYYRRSDRGGDRGAMLGGIIIGNMLGGGPGRSGGWSPTSFGGSDSGGGFLGGGGRF